MIVLALLGFWLLCLTINLGWCWWRCQPDWWATCRQWCRRDTAFCLAAVVVAWLWWGP